MSALTMILLSTLLRAAECPEGLRAQPVTSAARGLERTARAQAGDPCPDRALPSSAADESELLADIRRRSLPRLTRALAEGADADPGEAMSAFRRMRLHLAARDADVRWANGKLTLVPAVGLAHAAGFAKLEHLQPTENARLQATFRDSIESANARLAGASKAEASRIGAELRLAIRAAGRTDYDAAVAADPSLLFVDTDLDVIAARTRYQTALRDELRQLPALSVAPPEGEALALIFYDSALKEALRARPDLCGAFAALHARAKRNQRLIALLKGGLDLATSGGLCTAASAMGNLVVSVPVCLGNLAVGVLGPPKFTADRYRERQLLYGGY